MCLKYIRQNDGSSIRYVNFVKKQPLYIIRQIVILNYNCLTYHYFMLLVKFLYKTIVHFVVTSKFQAIFTNKVRI